jgi:hypothetical protein
MALIHYYAETYQTTEIGGYYNEVGQCFHGVDGYITSIKFYLKTSGTVSGNVVARIYDSTDGTFGVNMEPDYSADATSDNVDVTTIGTSYELVEFTFSTPYQIESGHDYIATVYFNDDALEGQLFKGIDSGYLADEGNICYRQNNLWWTTTNLLDTIFYIYGSIDTNSERLLYATGGLTNNSERGVYTRGGGVTSSERGIYTTSQTAHSDRGLYTEGKAMPVGIPFYSGEGEKKYSVKVFNRAGTTFKGSYDPIGGYSFNKVINGGVGDLTVNLPRKFDKYGLGDDVNLLDEIQIWVQDKDTSGKKIYSGYVSGITSYIDGNSQGITLDVLGYVSRLGFTLDWDGTDMSIARNSMTPGEIVKDVIDDYRTTVSEERINYGTSTVNIAGTDVSYTSNAKSCLETIDRVREMAGATWYWYVDADNVFYFDAYSTTPDHYFVFGKDVSSLEIKRSADDIKNELIFWNGLQADDTNFLSARYYHSSSITSYWNRFEQLTDSRITTDATADELGDAFINSYKDPNVSMKFEVKDNNLGDGYDIESIEPGHTCKILNLDDSDVVGDNMVITSVRYTPESAIIMVSDLREITGRSLTNLRRQLDSTVYGDRPADITSEEIS